MAQQYLRAASLIVADDKGNGVELAGPGQDQVLRITFVVDYMTNLSPASLRTKIYNLSPNTIQRIISLASKDKPHFDGLAGATSARVVLKAGYEENFSTVFTGQIYQIRVGKESNTDSYIELFAADGDMAHQYASVNTTFAKGYTAEDYWKIAGDSVQKWQVTPGPSPDGLNNAPASPRGAVAFGMTRDILRRHGQTYNYNPNIQDGHLQGLPVGSYRKGESIVVNSRTGMIGVPEQTEDGIQFVTLLNPSIRWGTRVQINEDDIARLLFRADGSNAALGTNVSFKEQQTVLIPPLNQSGFYVVMFATHVGDTRGNEWYSKCVCLSIDPSAQFPLATPILLQPPPYAK